MISRRKFLQGALGFASAAILPAGVIMPIKSEKIYLKEWVWGWPEIMRIEPFNFYPNPEDDNHVVFRDEAGEPREFPEIWQEDKLYDSIMKARKAMDEANVPQNDRIVRVPNNYLYRQFLEKNHVT